MSGATKNASTDLQRPMAFVKFELPGAKDGHIDLKLGAKWDSPVTRLEWTAGGESDQTIFLSRRVGSRTWPSGPIYLREEGVRFAKEARRGIILIARYIDFCRTRFEMKTTIPGYPDGNGDTEFLNPEGGAVAHGPITMHVRIEEKHRQDIEVFLAWLVQRIQQM